MKDFPPQNFIQIQNCCNEKSPGYLFVCVLMSTLIMFKIKISRIL